MMFPDSVKWRLGTFPELGNARLPFAHGDNGALWFFWIDAWLRREFWYRFGVTESGGAHLIVSEKSWVILYHQPCDFLYQQDVDAHYNRYGDIDGYFHQVFVRLNGERVFARAYRQKQDKS